MCAEKNGYFSLSLGICDLGLRFESEMETRKLAEYFEGHEGSGKPKVFINFKTAPYESVGTIPQSLVQEKRWENGSFSIADGMIAGKFDPILNLWTVTVKYYLLKGQTTRVFEQFLYQAFYTAVSKERLNAFMIHSCGVSAGGSGFLFIGASGMGKSTVASHSREYGVFNDEMNVVSLGETGYFLESSPFNAYFKGKCKERAKLRAIFILHHAKEFRLAPVSPAMAVSVIAGQIVPPIGLEDAFDPGTANAMMERAMELVSRIPVYRMSFTVEGGYWPQILETFAE